MALQCVPIAMPQSTVSQYIPAEAGFLHDKAAVLGDMIKGTTLFRNQKVMKILFPLNRVLNIRFQYNLRSLSS